jgi:MFS family permease
MAWFILTLGFFSSAIYTTIITLGSQQTKVASPKLVNFVLTCGTIGTMLTFVVTGPIVAHSGPLAALTTANGLYAVVFVMCFILASSAVIVSMRECFHICLPLSLRKHLPTPLPPFGRPISSAFRRSVAHCRIALFIRPLMC